MENLGPPRKHELYSSSSEMRALCAQWDQLFVQRGILYRKWVPEDARDCSEFQLVVPAEMRKEILFMLHNHKSSGHLGIAKTLKKLRQRFYWPGFKADTER